MIIQGRVAEILQPRTGKRNDGTEWKIQPFVVEYFENETDRQADSILLETFDQKVVENLQVDMTVRVVIGHRAEHWEKDGRSGVTNRIRIYNITCVAMPGHYAQPQAQAVAPAYVPPTEPSEEVDQLPF